MKKLKSRDTYKIIRIISTITLVALIFTTSIFAAPTDDPVTLINNLQDFIFTIVRAIGVILLLFSVVQIGLSLKSHDAQQRAQGFMCFAGGVIITLSKEILGLIGII